MWLNQPLLRSVKPSKLQTEDIRSNYLEVRADVDLYSADLQRWDVEELCFSAPLRLTGSGPELAPEYNYKSSRYKCAKGIQSEIKSGYMNRCYHSALMTTNILYK